MKRQMKDIFVVHGRKTSVVVGYFSNANECETMDVYGVFATFEAAMERFKQLTAEARDFFLESDPLGMDEEMKDMIKEADLLEDYDPLDCDEDFEFYGGASVMWSCDVCEGWNASFEMFSKSEDPTDIPLLPKLYIAKMSLED